MYAQVKLDPERFYAVHVDCLCVDPTAKSGAATGFTVGRTTVRLSCSNLYKRKSSRPDPAGAAATTLSGSAVNFVHEPPARKWHVLVFDTHGLVRRAAPPDTGAKSRVSKPATSKEPRGSTASRASSSAGTAPFATCSPPTPSTTPTRCPRTCTSRRSPGWTWCGIAWGAWMDQTPLIRCGPNVSTRSLPANGTHQQGHPPRAPAADDAELPTSAPIVAVPHATNMPTTPYATHDDATIEARRATPRGASTLLRRRSRKNKRQKNVNRPASVVAPAGGPRGRVPGPAAVPARR